MPKRLKLLWGVVAAVIAGAGTLGAVGLDVERYRPTWIYEHSDLEIIVFNMQLQDMKNRLYNLKLEADKMRREGVPVPDWIRQAIWELEEAIRQVEKKLG